MWVIYFVTVILMDTANLFLLKIAADILGVSTTNGLLSDWKSGTTNW